ncbi:glutamate--cysteine ligase [bacterium]|nr:glutamate--cysteine ligase [bacterium]
MLSQLKNILKNHAGDVEAWFETEWKGFTPPLYFSCDIRHSGHKMAVVDTNLFPGGFNNLCNTFSKATCLAFKNYFETYHPQAKKIILLAENHTRNKFYLKNVYQLQKIINDAGFECKAGMLGDTLAEASVTVDLDDLTLQLHKIYNQNGKIQIYGFIPDLVVSNNDFSEGIPEAIQNSSIPVIPSPYLGWHQRRKSTHFMILDSIIQKFCSHFDLDPWLLLPLSDLAENVDLRNEEHLKQLAFKVDSLLVAIKQKYDERGIKDTPLVYLKNNRGTYGMGVLPVFSGEDVLALNRKGKNKLLSAKGVQLDVADFLLQEGVHTIDTYSGQSIEPVIYGVGKNDIGGFFRIHETRNEWESLNAPGMFFSCLCLHKLDEPHEERFINCSEKERVVYLSRFLSRLASLACARER